MLEIRLLGQFDMRFGGKPIEVHSRPAQSLLAYLVLNAGVSQRREKLAGMLWPDSTEAKSRSYLRQALWRIRKALTAYPLSWRDYMRTDDISVEFGGTSDCWLDVDVVLERVDAQICSVEELIQIASVYRGELLPGFYDEWVYLERERLRAAYEHKMKLLLDRLLRDQCWEDVLHWGEQWISLGYASETAYRELMIAHACMGNTSSAIATFNRCVENLERELGVEPSPKTQEIREQLINGEVPEVVPSPPIVPERVLTDGPPVPGEPPFKGLQFFDESDADIFFGREVLTASLVNHLREGQSLLVVVGASGSGKSSIVRAGLVPALRCGEPLVDGKRPPKSSQDWLIRVITPTPHPLLSLATSLSRGHATSTDTTTLRDDLSRDPRNLRLAAKKITESSNTPKLLLVVDQFEELFTLCREEKERKAFIDNLLAAVEEEGDGPITVVITLRADFYAHCSEYPHLRKAIAKHQEYIGPMSAREMRRAIEGPARRGEWNFQPGMVDLFLRDVKGEPGALPLLSHALLETWRRRSGRTLTLKSYAASGGVGGAIAKTADTVFNSHLTQEEQVIARNIFLRLTGLGEDTQHTRRRVESSELVLDPDEAPAVEEVLKKLADARLITTYENTVEVAHEALIREWPALQEWLEEDREGLKLHRHLTESAQEWKGLNRDHGELYRGARLAQAVDWAMGNDGQLNELEREFLRASQVYTAEEEAEREARRHRELETSQELAVVEERRAAEQTSAGPRTRWWAIGLSAFLVIAVIAIISLFGDQLVPGLQVQPAQVADVSETKTPELPSTEDGFITGELLFEDDSNQIPFELIDDDGALYLDGVNDKAEISYSPALAIYDEITIEAWIKVNKFPPCNLGMDCWSDTCRYIAILNQAHSESSAGNYTLAVGPDGLLFAFETIDTRLMGEVEIPEGEWIHIAVAHRWGDGTAARFYVNGIPVENSQWVNDRGHLISGNQFPLNNSGSPYYIGAFGLTPSTRNWNTFNGVIDELRIWKVQKSQEEIRVSMSTELVGNEPDLSAYWNFNMPVGSSGVVDRSGNGNTVSLRGGAKVVSGEELTPDLPSSGEGFEVGDLIFEDDFDDVPSNIWNFVCEQDWDTKEINGRSVFVADWDKCDAADTFQVPVQDYLVEFDFFLVSPSKVGDYSLIVATRAFGCSPVTQRHSRSELSLAPEGEYFFFYACDSNDQFEARNDLSVSHGEWHTMRTINFGDKYQAIIDDTEIFNLFVINPDIGGNIVLDVLPGTEYYIDNFRVYELNPREE